MVAGVAVFSVRQWLGVRLSCEPDRLTVIAGAFEGGDFGFALDGARAAGVKRSQTATAGASLWLGAPVDRSATPWPTASSSCGDA